MFRVRPFEAKTLSWWYSRRDSIDLDPPYQRRSGVWSVRSKAYLIDSILNEYDVPKVYVADFSFANSRLNLTQKQFAVIDGKQRLEAIFGFFDGDFALASDFLFETEPNLRLARFGYRDLKKVYPKIADVFDNFNLTVMSIITDDESKINSLFVRLNQTKPLTGAELRNAMLGVVPRLIRSIANHGFFKEYIRFKTERGEDRNVGAKLLLLEFRGTFVDLKKRQLDRFVDEGIQADAQVVDFERAAERVLETLTAMTSVFLAKDILLSSQGPLPVYYWLVRQADEPRRGLIRAFLIGFADSRRRNRDFAKEGESRLVDPELVEYDRFERSTNDQGSLEGRFDILWRRFSAYAEAESNELAKILRQFPVGMQLRVTVDEGSAVSTRDRVIEALRLLGREPLWADARPGSLDFRVLPLVSQSVDGRPPSAEVPT
jgi:hypothetical protein